MLSHNPTRSLCSTASGIILASHGPLPGAILCATMVASTGPHFLCTSLFLLAGPSKAGSTVSAASKLSRHTALDAAAKAAPCGAVQCSCTQPVSLPVAGAPTDHVQQHSTSSNGCAWSAEGLPAKPGSTPISPDDLFKARRQARAAAIANARVKPATFVLPAGGPHDGQEQRMPQGKGKPQVQAGATSNAQNQVG